MYHWKASAAVTAALFLSVGLARAGTITDLASRDPMMASAGLTSASYNSSTHVFSLSASSGANTQLTEDLNNGPWYSFDSAGNLFTLTTTLDWNAGTASNTTLQIAGSIYDPYGSDPSVPYVFVNNVNYGSPIPFDTGTSQGYQAISFKLPAIGSDYGPWHGQDLIVKVFFLSSSYDNWAVDGFSYANRVTNIKADTFAAPVPLPMPAVAGALGLGLLAGRRWFSARAR